MKVHRLDHLVLTVKRYLQDACLEVVRMKGLGVATPVEQNKLADFRSQFHTAETGADAVLIRGRWASVVYVEQIEHDTGLPVVSRNAASLWSVLKTLGMKIRVEGCGLLLREP